MFKLSFILVLAMTPWCQLNAKKTSIDVQVPNYDSRLLFQTILNIWQDSEFRDLNKTDKLSVIRGFRILIEKHIFKLKQTQY